MSVLINMEMPKSCSECPMCGLYSEHKGDVHRCDITFCPVEYEDGLDKRHKDCPLLPVPPHGRLIDADALPTYDKPIGKMMMFGGEYVYTQTAIDNAPTIIQAEGGSERTSNNG